VPAADAGGGDAWAAAMTTMSGRRHRAMSPATDSPTDSRRCCSCRSNLQQLLATSARPDGRASAGLMMTHYLKRF